MAPTTSTPTSTSITSSKTGTFYLAFGSNLSPTQMRGRLTASLSSSTPIAIARLDGWKWIICQRGYANIVEVPSPVTVPRSVTEPASLSKAISNGNAHSSIDADAEIPDTTVWGILYNLSPADEATLDKYEGHNYYRNPFPRENPIVEDRACKPHEQGGWDYNKLYLPVTVTKWLVDPETFGLDIQGGAPAVKVLVYVDELRTSAGKINPEYIGRMNRAIDESVKLGLPGQWCERVMRTWVRKGVYPKDRYFGTSEGYFEGEED